MFKFILVQMSFLMSVLVCSHSFAAIPTASTIFNRYTHNNGRTGYIVEQEVQFQTEPDAPVLREKWIIENANTMYLVVSGEQVGSAHMEVLYKEAASSPQPQAQNSSSLIYIIEQRGVCWMRF
jgi:hypothetical protein